MSPKKIRAILLTFGFIIMAFSCAKVQNSKNSVKLAPEGSDVLKTRGNNINQRTPSAGEVDVTILVYDPYLRDAYQTSKSLSELQVEHGPIDIGGGKFKVFTSNPDDDIKSLIVNYFSKSDQQIRNNGFDFFANLIFKSGTDHKNYHIANLQNGVGGVFHFRKFPKNNALDREASFKEYLNICAPWVACEEPMYKSPGDAIGEDWCLALGDKLQGEDFGKVFEMGQNVRKEIWIVGPKGFGLGRLTSSGDSNEGILASLKCPNYPNLTANVHIFGYEYNRITTADTNNKDELVKKNDPNEVDDSIKNLKNLPKVEQGGFACGEPLMNFTYGKISGKTFHYFRDTHLRKAASSKATAVFPNYFNNQNADVIGCFDGVDEEYKVWLCVNVKDNVAGSSQLHNGWAVAGKDFKTCAEAEAAMVDVK